MLRLISFSIYIYRVFLSFVENICFRHFPPTWAKRQTHTRIQIILGYMPAHITDTTQVRGHTLMYTHTQTKTDKRTFKSVNPPPCLRNHNHNHSFFLCILSLRLYFFSRISPLICRNLIFMTNNKTRRLTPSLVPESQMEEEERGGRERHRVGDVTKRMETIRIWTVTRICNYVWYCVSCFPVFRHEIYRCWTCHSVFSEWQSWKRVILMVQLKKSTEDKVLIIPSSRPIQIFYF